MKNVVVLTGLFPPQVSANSNIAFNIVEELKEKYNIIVITRASGLKFKKKEQLNNVKIIRNRDWNQIIHNKCTEEIKKNRELFKMVLFIKKIIFFVPKIFRMQNYSKYYTKKIYKTLKSVNKKYKIDIIIPISSPHEEIFAALKFKKINKTVKLIPYQLDRFSNGNSLYATNFLRSYKYNNNIKLEKEIIKYSEKLFILPPIYSHYKNDVELSNEEISKIEITEHPLIKKIQKITNKKNDNVNILYAGTLDMKLRNPTYLFELLNDQNIVESNIKLQLYSFGNCQSIINNYKKKIPNIICDNGKIEHKILVNKMQEANILLSIGNNSNNEVPSKLFEYLSFGKPIIHLYYSDYDAYLKYLQNYKYSICIKMDESNIMQNRKMFYNFCMENSNVDIDFDVIEKEFTDCTPKYVSNQFINQIEGEK